MFNGEAILITGGTGSFGRECSKLILERYKPKRLIIFSRDELKQFEMASRLEHSSLRFFLGDVRDVTRLREAFQDVDYVVHAAALKQVPAAEYNPLECIKTNIHGAQNVISAALEAGVKKVIALSTDKAVSPVNLYGATKLCSDKLFIAANNIVGGHDTRFSVARYGNVTGSRGSVVPHFKNLVEGGAKELPITDRRMTRFWITINQSALFILKSFERMHGGEIFVPKIPSVRITDLAKAIGPHLKIKVIGIRPGEKLHETLCPQDEAHHTIEFEDHFVIIPAIKFYDRSSNFFVNFLNEEGKTVEERFEYNSGSNPHFLSVEELKENYLTPD